MKYLMIWLVGLYRKFISPLKRPCCRYTPTCSAYAIEAFKKRGFIIGMILTTWRILRCNPFSKGGYDPVPEKGLRRVKGAVPPELLCECDPSDEISDTPDEAAPSGEAIENEKENTVDAEGDPEVIENAPEV